MGRGTILRACECRLYFTRCAGAVAVFLQLQFVQFTRPKVGVILELSKDNMVFDDDCELSEGVSYEMLQENDFTRQISIYTNGFVRLHPYNQVAEQGEPPYEHHIILPNFRSSPSVF